MASQTNSLLLALVVLALSCLLPLVQSAGIPGLDMLEGVPGLDMVSGLTGAIPGMDMVDGLTGGVLGNVPVVGDFLG